MRHVEELATDLSLYDTSHRLIKLLLQSLDPANIQKYNLIHSLSNSEIAKLIGSVRQVVERHLKKLKLAGIIETNKKHIDIKQIDKLLEKL
jgi:DNA-binding transcriptional ArsR family regulator